MQGNTIKTLQQAWWASNSTFICTIMLTSLFRYAIFWALNCGFKINNYVFTISRHTIVGRATKYSQCGHVTDKCMLFSRICNSIMPEQNCTIFLWKFPRDRTPNFSRIRFAITEIHAFKVHLVSSLFFLIFFFFYSLEKLQ